MGRIRKGQVEPVNRASKGTLPIPWQLTLSFSWLMRTARLNSSFLLLSDLVIIYAAATTQRQRRDRLMHQKLAAQRVL